MTEEQLKSVPIETEMKSSYIDYAMSVIVSRALPDVRDGLKPVHRRILYSMSKLGLEPKAEFKKCATIVGDVIGKYHPHGDAAVYDSLVRLAQDFNMRYKLVEGHGNFGSIDGDPAAAYRYTEAKMTPFAMELLKDIDKNTVSFSDNFDGTQKEPDVLPASFPNLLVNGSTGIAVGMATNIPPHNLKESVEALVAMIDKPEIDCAELMHYIKAPDFPSGALIMGSKGCRDLYEKGKGSITIRAKIEIEELKYKKCAIIVKEIPYQINKNRLVEQIADGIKNGKINHVADLRDESDRNGMRLVIELTANANRKLVLNQLYKHSNLQCNFTATMLAIHDGVPKLLTLKEILSHYLEHKRKVVKARLKYDLKRAKDRAHILEGLIRATDIIDEIIALIRSSKNRKEAESRLIKELQFSKIQAVAILEMQLMMLTSLQKNRLTKEYAELLKQIKTIEKLLESKQSFNELLKTELKEVAKKYGDERKSKILSNTPEDLEPEELIPDEKLAITLMSNGFLRKSAAANTQTESLPIWEGGELICNTSAHQDLYMLSSAGKSYKVKVYELPDEGRGKRGTAPINIVPLDTGEKIVYIFATNELPPEKHLILVTANGYSKKIALSEFVSSRKAGVMAIKMEEGDSVISVLSSDQKEALLVSQNGATALIDIAELKESSRRGKGNKIIKLDFGDRFITVLEELDGKELIAITKNGFAGRISMLRHRIPIKSRKRIDILKVKKGTDQVIVAMTGNKKESLELTTFRGDKKTLLISEIKASGKGGYGNRIIELKDGDYIISALKNRNEKIV